MHPLSVNLARDRRLAAGFVFNGTLFQGDALSLARINRAAGSARDAIAFNGAKPGDLRWHGADVDFYWIASDNSHVTMDAPTVIAFAAAANIHEGLHVAAGAALKAMDPIPADYDDDKYWPASGAADA